MARILIIGYGNPMRSDDRIGWELAHQLSQTIREDDVEIVAAYQLTPEMAESASRAERILFVDACREGCPGTVKCDEVIPLASGGSFTHDLTPAAILAIARTLYGRCPSAKLLTVAGESFEMGESISPVVSRAVPQLLREVQNFIRDAGSQ